MVSAETGGWYTFGDYLNKYAGYRFVIVGKGPTPVDYKSLSHITGPVIFLNDAVGLEHLAPNSVERFFMTAHAIMGVYITPERKSTIVLPSEQLTDKPIKQRSLRVRRDGTISSSDYSLRDLDRVVLYKWGTPIRDVASLSLTRSEAVKLDTLYDAGSISHRATHFAWMCGATEIAYIGCDGDGTDYDPRIAIRSGSQGMGKFAEIRQELGDQCGHLDIDADFVRRPHLEAIIPRIAHFVWLGQQPDWLARILDEFKARNPKWQVNLWTKPPSDMPHALLTASDRCKQLCQRADIFYCWLLFSRGGVVLDTDMVAIDSFEPLRRVTPAWTTPHKGLTGRLTNGAMGAIRGAPFFRRAVDRIVEIDTAVANGQRPWARCQYMDHLTALHAEDDSQLNVLPADRFYPWWYTDRDRAAAFWKAGEAERQAMLRSIRDSFTDGRPPFAVHLWGIEGSSKRPV